MAGVIPRAIAQIFSKLDTDDSEYTVKCSFLELYNEETTDLLAVGDAAKSAQQKLRIMEDRNGAPASGRADAVSRQEGRRAWLQRGKVVSWQPPRWQFGGGGDATWQRIEPAA